MEVYIIGCGGNSKIVTDICELNNYTIRGFFDDSATNCFKNYKLIGKIDDIYKYDSINIINSIGNNIVREKIHQKLSSINLNWINCIHPGAHITPSAKLGKGNIICYGAVINSDAIIGNFNLVNTYAVIEHDNILGDFNHIAPRVALCGGVRIGNLNLIGVGTSVIPDKKIGNSNIVGAGTAIIRDFGDNNMIVGVPGVSKKNNK